MDTGLIYYVLGVVAFALVALGVAGWRRSKSTPRDPRLSEPDAKTGISEDEWWQGTR